MPKACRHCSTRISRSTPRINTSQGVACFTAVFSDNWNWSFNPKNHRSRRRRFADSGEKITGFTAVFSDDWKDEEGDSVFSYARPLGCDNLQWDKSRKKNKDADTFAEDSASTWPPFKRQREEHCNLLRTETMFSAATPNIQQYQFGGSQSKNCPSSLTSANTFTRSSTMSTDDNSIRRLVSSESTTPSQPSSVYSMTTDMALPTEKDRHMYLNSAEGGLEYPPLMLAAEATNVQDSVTVSSKPLLDYHRSPEEKRITEDWGFNYWEQFIEYGIMVDGGPKLDAFQE